MELQQDTEQRMCTLMAHVWWQKGISLSYFFFVNRLMDCGLVLTCMNTF